MRWYLVTFKDGSRVETLAPHHNTIRNDDPENKILFVRQLEDDEDLQNLSEKRRYYNGSSRQSRPAKDQIWRGECGKDQTD